MKYARYLAVAWPRKLTEGGREHRAPDVAVTHDCSLTDSQTDRRNAAIFGFRLLPFELIKARRGKKQTRKVQSSVHDFDIRGSQVTKTVF